MENQISITEFLKRSREKRSNSLQIANEFFEKVVREETRKVSSRNRVNSRENSEILQRKRTLLEPIKERRPVKSRTLISENKGNIL